MGIFEFFRRKPSAPRESESEVLARVLHRIGGHRRTAWIPRTEDGRTHLGGSKFGGLPYLRLGEEWPTCGNCKRPMQLFLQLCGADLPPKVEATPGSSGILQLFYCTSAKPRCESACEGWAAPGISTLLRVIEATTPAHPLTASPVTGAFAEKRIVAWDPVDDYPNAEELSLLEIQLDDVEAEVLMNEEVTRATGTSWAAGPAGSSP